MRIIIFQDEKTLLRQLCQSRPLGRLLLTSWMRHYASEQGPAEVLVPQNWTAANDQLKKLDPLRYEGAAWSDWPAALESDAETICLLNGRTVISVDFEAVEQALDSVSWQAASVEVAPQLQPSREILKLTPEHHVVGVRRFYTASVEPIPRPGQWPDILFFKRDTWTAICEAGGFPLEYAELLKRLDTQAICFLNLRVGGSIRRLESAAAFLECLETLPTDDRADEGADGPAVFCGDSVTVEPGVRLIGPMVLGDRVTVRSGAVVRRAIITDGAVVESGQVVNSAVVLEGGRQVPVEAEEDAASAEESLAANDYKSWRWFSYAQLGKRVFDMVASAAVLLLLLPILVIVGVVVKATSPGPVFYRARRQGRHGREFDCLKFRSMMVAADAMQERLRVVNQVDGPQFKMENDPRITGICKFLRDTYIDELPQFINVLLGQMSIVGPRPSPENENDSSPAWRDARLSVRPGITGLWQIMRTRREGMDFQEWVFYDTHYVRSLSFRQDLWICWKTARKLVHSFLGQFG